MKLSPLLIILLIGSFYSTSAYRLNVPRVLLPYYSKNQVSYILEVKEPDGGCFYWKSTRPDIVSVEPMGKSCSSKALITARSLHSAEQSAIIVASSSDGKETLTCDVRVDVVDRIEVHTTTGLLFIEEPPARITVNAFNKRGNEFSTLGSIPFEWSLKSTGSPHTLRIVRFSDSVYEVPFGIGELENKNKQGASILIDGIQTGKATLSAKIVDSEFADVESCEMDLFVIQKAILVPSDELYIPVGAFINFGVSIVKQSGIEAVKLPSPLFRVSIDDDKICHLDEKNSRVIAQKIGTTRLTLVDTTFEKFSEGMFEFVKINVVPSEAVGYFFDRGDNWQIMLKGQYFKADKIDLAETSLVEYGKTARINFNHPGEIISDSWTPDYESTNKIPEAPEIPKANVISPSTVLSPPIKPKSKSVYANKEYQVDRPADLPYCQKPKGSSIFTGFGIPAILSEFFDRNIGLFVMLFTASLAVSAVAGVIWMFNNTQTKGPIKPVSQDDIQNTSHGTFKYSGDRSKSFVD
jgi:hypothetical protein